MTGDTRPLLILDLDETLVFAREGRLAREPDFLVPPYAVYRRPGLQAFLEHVGRHYRLAVWTSSSPLYASAVCRALFPDPDVLEFVWASDRCTLRRDLELDAFYSMKHLSKVKRRGHALERVLVVDDSPEKHTRNYGNLVRVAPFEGNPDDDELAHLGPYLERLASEPNVRRVEKRHWRRRVAAGPTRHDGESGQTS